MDEGSSKSNKEKQGNSSNSQKKVSKVQKKPRKRVKGQKDIRTLIKPKKNELVTYSKEFDLICKQSGIDVDSEQLQLAIALSKSLQDSEKVINDNTDTQKSLTTNQRKGIIRTTLQEYGFKVPDIKCCKNNKAKKYKKQYKLLLATDTEKQERIANNYAQILFTNISICCVNEDNINCQNSSSFLYHISTNISYEHIKNDAIYYVDNLVEIPLTEKHHILRDWSEIPGRPKSPVRELSSNIYFKSLNCSQKELSNILSGTIKTAQETVRKIYCSNKLDTSSSKEDNIKNPDNNSVYPKLQDTCSNSLLIEANLSDNTPNCLTANKNHIESESTVEETFIMPPPANRSCSPDIFDDEVTIIMDKSKDTITLQEDLSDKVMVREQNDYMDLTECVNVLNCNTVNFKQNSCLSQETNKTKMNPNDFMELTGCVTASSQKIIIDAESFIEKENCSPNVIKNCENDIMDLTQTPKSNNSSQIRGDADNKSLDDTIIVVDEDYININAGCDLSKSTTQKSVIIDLIGSPQVPSKLNNSGHNSTINLIHSPKEDENGEKETNNLEFQNEKVCNFATDFTENCRSSRHDSLAYYDNKKEDAMDLTQSSNSEDSPSATQMREYSKSPIDRSINEETEKDTAENQRNSSVDSTHSNDKDYHYGYGYDSPIFMNDHDFYRFDSPINDIPLNYNSSNTNISEDGNNGNGKDQEMDLTQSSSSENRENNSSSGVKSLDDTIVLNDDYYSHSLVNNEIRVDEKEPVNSENDSPVKYQSQNKYKITMNECSNHDNDVIEHVDRDSFSEVKISSPYRLDEFSVKDNVSSYSKKNRGLNINDDSKEDNLEIDLTQHSDGAEEIFMPDIVEVPSGNNFSIDYDYDLNNVQIRFSNGNDSKNFVEKEKKSSIDEANSSQNSAVFEISDDEFNYSINQRKEDDDSIRLDRTRFNIGGTSAIDEFLNRNSLSKSKLRCSCGSNFDPMSSNENKDICQPEIAFTNDVDLLGVGINKKAKSCTELESFKVSTPSKSMSNESILLAQTPRHNDYVIKTDVTPMPNYELMTSPERNAELDKFGIKPLKRKRAIQILTHIYNQMHPVMEILSNTEDYSSPSKIRRKNEHTSFPRRIIASQIDLVEENNYIEPGPSLPVESLSQKSSKSFIELSKNSKKSLYKDCNLYEENKQLPDIKNIECCEDWVFQTREKAKVHSCRVPLHIAFHNYVSCRQALREAILRYEPINIDDIHKGLVATGYRYNPKDLLKFMDKKCITVKTADSSRNAIK